MKWIKASEGLPGKLSFKIIFRQISTKTVLSLSTVIDWVEDKYLHDLEWLDESPTPPEGKVYSLEQVADTWDAAVNHTRDLSNHPPAYPNKENFLASISPQPVKDDWVDKIEKRIAELNNADAAFCKDRWNMALDSNTRLTAREMSNQVTFARQVLQEFLPTQQTKINNNPGQKQ